MYNEKVTFDACCVCGGGIHHSTQPSDEPSLFPSDTPTMNPTSSSIPSVTPSRRTPQPSEQPSLSQRPTYFPSYPPRSFYDGHSCNYSIECKNLLASCVQKICSVSASTRRTVEDFDDYTANYYSLAEGRHQILSKKRKMSSIDIMSSIFETDAIISYAPEDNAAEGGCLKMDPTNLALTIDNNVWETFELAAPYDITRSTRLRFRYTLIEEASGHAICLDYNRFADTAKRCVSLAGTDLNLNQPYAPANDMDISSGKIYNLALGKHATQSSTSHYKLSNAGKAVDGYIDPTWRNNDIGGNSVSRTLEESEPWWEVDLGNEYEISSIHIHKASGLDDQCSTLTIAIYRGSAWTSDYDLEPGPVSTISIEDTGSKVKIKCLSGFIALAEVLVMGDTFDATPKDVDIPIGEMLFEDVSFGFPIWNGMKRDLALNQDISHGYFDFDHKHIFTDVIISGDNGCEHTIEVTHNGIIKYAATRVETSFALPNNLIGDRIVFGCSNNLVITTVQVIGGNLTMTELNTYLNTQPQINYISFIQDSRDGNEMVKSIVEGVELFEEVEVDYSTATVVSMILLTTLFYVFTFSFQTSF